MLQSTSGVKRRRALLGRNLLRDNPEGFISDDRLRMPRSPRPRAECSLFGVQREPCKRSD